MDQPKVCRICLLEEKNPKNDPIVAPCRCRGHSGNVHLNCLQKWLESKLKVKRQTEYQTNYVFKRTKCELCTQLYPDQVQVSGRVHQVFRFKRPSKAKTFIVFEILGLPNGKNFSVVLIPPFYDLEIGRQLADIVIPDMTVHQRHAILKHDLAINELVLTENE